MALRGLFQRRYKHRFICRCPNNSRPIDYEWTIEIAEVIAVEDIVATAKGYARSFHEAMADELYKLFGGRQILRAHHHGVDIETVRP
jgi:hypothetical protein